MSCSGRDCILWCGYITVYGCLCKAIGQHKTKSKKCCKFDGEIKKTSYFLDLTQLAFALQTNAGKIPNVTKCLKAAY